MASQVGCPPVYLDAWNNARIAQGFTEWKAVFCLLADCFIVEDCAIDVLAQRGRGDDEIAIGAPSLFGLRDTQ